MSHPRLHQTLSALLEHKDPTQLLLCQAHEAYTAFQTVHGLKIPQEELILAFTHTSFSHEFNWAHQEQLEFLGDSVLQLILTEELYERFPQEKEGRLSKLRSAIVNEKTLARIAFHVGLGELILVGRGEFNKKLFEQDTVLADTLEALLAQVYRYQGLNFVKELFLNWLLASFPHALSWEFLEDFDSKSKLQEMTLAKYKKLPRYSAEPSGEKFDVKLWINEELKAQGTFSSKKIGEKELAQEVLKKGII